MCSFSQSHLVALRVTFWPITTCVKVNISRIINCIVLHTHKRTSAKEMARKFKHLWQVLKFTLHEILPFSNYTLMGGENTFPRNSGHKPKRDEMLAVLQWHLEAAVGILEDLLLYSFAINHFLSLTCSTHTHMHTYSVDTCRMHYYTVCLLPV